MLEKANIEGDVKANKLLTHLICLELDSSEQRLINQPIT